MTKEQLEDKIEKIKSWTKICKTFILIVLTIFAMTMLAFTGWEIAKDSVILGSELIGATVMIIAIFGKTLDLLMKHERRQIDRFVKIYEISKGVINGKAN